VFKKFEPPLLLQLKPSTRLRQVIAAAHGLALAAAWANGLPVIYKMVLSTGLFVHFYHALKRLDKPQPTIQYTEASGWELADNDEFEPVSIRNSTVLTIYAIWLHVKRRNTSGCFDKAERNILIVSDALDEDDYRRLIVKLKTTVEK